VIAQILYNFIHLKSDQDFFVMKKDIAAVIKLVRKDNSLTQAMLAEVLGFTPGHIGSLEQEKGKPSYDLMEQLIARYNIDANLFFGRTLSNTVSLDAKVLLEMQEKLGAVQDQLRLYGDSIELPMEPGNPENPENKYGSVGI